MEKRYRLFAMERFRGAHPASADDERQCIIGYPDVIVYHIQDHFRQINCLLLCIRRIPEKPQSLGYLGYHYGED